MNLTEKKVTQLEAEVTKLTKALTSAKSKDIKEQLTVAIAKVKKQIANFNVATEAVQNQVAKATKLSKCALIRSLVADASPSDELTKEDIVVYTGGLLGLNLADPKVFKAHERTCSAQTSVNRLFEESGIKAEKAVVNGKTIIYNVENK